MHFAIDTTSIFSDQADMVRLEIFLLELRKKHIIWDWEDFGDREPCIVYNFRDKD